MAAEFLTPPPRDFTDRSGIDLEAFSRSIRDGRAGTAMKPYRGILSNDEINFVVQYIYKTFTICRLTPKYYHSIENGWPDHQKRYGLAYPFVLGDIPSDQPAEFLTRGEWQGLYIYRNACITCHERQGTDAGADLKEAEGHRHFEETKDGAKVEYQNPATLPKVSNEYVLRTQHNTGHEEEHDGGYEGGYGYGIGDGPHDRPPVISDLTPFEDRGEHLYLENCAYCHAADGTGRNWIGSFLQPNPPDFTDQEITSGYTDDSIRQAIVKGLPDTSMPAFRSVMTQEQVAAIVAYMRRAFLDHPHSGQ